MLVRWYQVGAFGPFFRAHAHIDTKRREPYLLEDPYKSIVRNVLRLRYTMLPIWYTAFRETSVTGVPVVRYVYRYTKYIKETGVKSCPQTSICDVPWRYDRLRDR